MKTSVIITLIVSATVVAIVAVVFDYLSDKNSDKQVELSKKIIRLHRNYIAAILGFAIIMLLTAKYGVPCYRYVYEYLSFASTITSLVLSILAIFVTVQSSSDLYKQFTKIEEATKIVKKSSEDIKETLDHLQNSEKEIKTTSSELSNKFNDLVNEIVKEVKVIVKASECNMIEKIENNLNLTNPSNADPEQETTSVVSTPDNNGGLHNAEKKLKEAFLGRASNFGLIALYACVLSCEEGISFSLRLFDGDAEYFWGFLMAIASVGFVDLERIDNGDIRCKKSKYTKEEVKKIIEDRIKKMSETSENGALDFKGKFEKIKDFFEK